MTINIQEHMLVPKHEIMTDSEIEDLKNSADYDIENLPRIKVDDPVVKDIDAKENDILRITRESDTAGTFVTYRIVISLFLYFFIVFWKFIIINLNLV